MVQNAPHDDAPFPCPDVVPVERDLLLQRLRTAADTAGSRLLLVGEPGVGKSTLLDVAAERARSRGARVLHVRASQHDAGHPFQGFVDLLDTVEEDLLDALPAAQRAALEIALGRRPAEHDLPPTAVHRAVAALLTGLLARQPVVLVVDGWPSVDAETTAVLHHLLRRRGPGAPGGPRPSLLAAQQVQEVLSGDPDPIDTAVFAADDVLVVPALGAEGLGEVLRARTGEEVPVETLAALHRVTGGNPLWAMELLADPRPLLREREVDESRTPASITAAVRARIERLPAPVLEVLATTAAAGSADPAALAAFVSGGSRAVSDALERERVVRLVDGRFRSAHPVLGGAALAHLGAWPLLQLHRRLADVAPTAAERARHLDLAAPPGPDAAAADALAVATAEHRARGALLAALRTAERAVARTAPGLPVHGARVAVVAEIAFAAGRLDHVLDVLDAPAVAGLELAAFDRAVPLLLDALTVSPRGERAVLEELDALDRLVAGDPVRAAVLQVYESELVAHPVDQRCALAERALAALAGEPRVPVARHRALGALVLARVDAGDGLDEDLLARSEELERDLRLVAPNDSARAQRGFHAYEVDDLASSRLALTALREETTGIGEDLMSSVFAVHLAFVELFSGHPGAAAGLLAEVVGREPWASHPPPAVVRALGALALTRGDEEEVRRLVALPAGSGSQGHGRIVRTALPGLLAARREEWSQAVGPLLEARAVADAAGLREPGRRSWLDVELGETLVALDRGEEAAEVAAWLGEVAGRGDRPLARGQELRLRGLLAAGERDLAQAERLLTASVDVLAPTGYALEHARSLLELGRVLRRRRALSRAREVFEQTLALAVENEDVLLRARVERELPGTATGRGAHLLTPTELDVARAVARGARNREVAAAQFVSVRTVEAHLSRVFHKLGIRSRSQLAGRLHEIDVGIRGSTDDRTRCGA